MSFLREVVENLLSKPCTILYPVEKVTIPEAFRGQVCIDNEKCIGCSKCALVCPSGCITMVADSKEIEFKGKKLVRKKRPEVRLFQCIRCGLCAQHCPSEGIVMKNILSCSGTECEVVVK